MRGKYSKFINAIHFSGDLVLLCFSFVLGYYLRWESSLEGMFNSYNLTILILMIFAWGLSVHFLKILDVQRVSQIDQLIKKTVKAIFFNTFLLFSLIVLLKGYDVSRKWLLLVFGPFYFFIIMWKLVFYKIIKWFRNKGYNYRNVVIVGAGPVGREMKRFFKSDQSYGYRFLGFFDDNIGVCQEEEYLGVISDLDEYSKNNQIDEIYCALPDYAHKKIRLLRGVCDENMLRFKVIPDFRKFSGRRVVMDFYGRIPVIHQRAEPLESLANRIEKRIFDIVFSLGVIIFVFPWLYLIIALAIKINSNGPVLFKQKRSGIGNKAFNCLKFRSMSINSNSDLKQATKNDARITSVGTFLRKSSLDEFPQFFNVLKGDMSIVGPRPHMLRHTEEYSRIIDKFMVRHLCKPGITGWAQVNGYRGETKKPEEMEKRVIADIWYLERWSFLLDLRIVFLTVKNALKGEDNAY